MQSNYTREFSTITGHYIIESRTGNRQVFWISEMDIKMAKESIATIKSELRLLKVKRGLNTLRNLADKAGAAKEIAHLDKEEKQLEKWLKDCQKRIDHIKGVESGKVVEIEKHRNNEVSIWDVYH